MPEQLGDPLAVHHVGLTARDRLDVLSVGSTVDAKGSRQTIFNVGTLDPDQSIKNALKALHPDPSCAYYSLAEKYAEWGVAEMGAQMDAGKLSLASFLTEAEELLDKKAD
jgi:hypothetical protein